MAIGLLSSIAGFAQYMPDTTVQICAYWSKGDKIAYECSHKQLKTDKTGEEVVTSSSKETRIVEVLDESEKSYVLQLGYKDVLSMDAEVDFSNELLNKFSDVLKIRFRTDEFGSIEEILDMENTIALLKAQSAVLVEDMYSKNEQIQKVLTKEQLLASVMSICTENYLVKLCLDDISPLLTYHGGKYEIGSEYNVEQTFNIGNRAFSGDMTFWVDPEESDSAYAVIRSYLMVDTKEIMDASFEMMLGALKASYPDADAEKLKAELDKEIADKHMSCKFEQFSTTYIHVNSGWTTNWYFDRVLTLSGDDGETQTIDRRSMEILEE